MSEGQLPNLYPFINQFLCIIKLLRIKQPKSILSRVRKIVDYDEQAQTHKINLHRFASI